MLIPYSDVEFVVDVVHFIGFWSLSISTLVFSSLLFSSLFLIDVVDPFRMLPLNSLNSKPLLEDA